MSEEGEISDLGEPLLGLSENKVDSDMDSSSDSSESIDTRVALPVAPFSDAFTPTSTPKCGEEYLALVRHQRRQLPSVFAVDSDNDDAGNSGTMEEPKQKSARIDKEPVLKVSKEIVDQILAEFDAKRPTEFDDERECLKELSEAVKEGFYDKAYNILLRLDSRLTSNQTSLLRSIAKQSDDLTLTILICCRFGQKDLLHID